MGACDVTLTLKGKASKILIERELEKRIEQDKAENGHQHGYSGDFQTINNFIYDFRVFNSAQEAFEWCSKNVEKWTAIVVYYKTNDVLQPVFKTLVYGVAAC